MARNDKGNAINATLRRFIVFGLQMLLRRSNFSYGFSWLILTKAEKLYSSIKHKNKWSYHYICGYSSKAGTVHKTVIVFSATIYESDSLFPDFYIFHYSSCGMIYGLGGCKAMKTKTAERAHGAVNNHNIHQ